MRSRLFFVVLAFASLICSTSAALAQPTPLSTAFTYQGELASAGAPTTGTYDIRFRLYDAPTGGSQIGSTLCSDNLAIDAGRFAAALDFGAAAFAGQKRFLEIEIRQDTGLGCGDATGYTVLSPRQELTAAPNATYAQNAAIATTAGNATNLNGQPASYFTNGANLTGTIVDARLSGNIARLDGNQTFTGQLTLSNPANNFTGNGSGLTNLSGGNISAGTLARSSLSTDVQSGLGTLAPDWNSAQVLGLSASLGMTGVAVSGSNAFVLSPGRLNVFNITNPAAPALTGVALDPIGGYLTSIAVLGNLAYVTNASSNFLRIYDISSPAAPVLAGSVGTGTYPAFVTVSGSYAYVVNRDSNSLQILNISNPATPSVTASITTGTSPICVAVSGNYAYVTCFGSNDANRLQVFNVSNPAAPAFVGNSTTGARPSFVAISGTSAYITSFSDSMLQVFDLGNPTAPALVGSAAAGTNPVAVAVAPPYAYVVNNGSNAMQVFRISTPAAPSLVTSVATIASPLFVAVSGSSAYVTGSTNPGGLQIIGAPNRVGLGAPLSASSLSGANGSGLINLNAANLTGTVAVGRLPALVARTDTANSFGSFLNTFAGQVGIGTDFTTLPLSFGTTLGNKIALYDGPGDFWGFSTIAGGLQIKTGGTERMRFTNSGVAIGTTTVPSTGLEVAGGLMASSGTTVHAQGAFLEWNKNSGDGATWLLNQKGQGPGGFVFGEVNSANLVTQRLRIEANGNVTVVNSLAKAGGSFKIDHPLDPENKYLYHSFVESPDMMNIYNGVVRTDAGGFAVVEMPDYFEALNRDFRYQLTVVDDSDNDFILTKVYREIGAEAPRQFTIKSSMPNIKVSWQVTGIRKDAWAEKNRIPNTVEKPAGEKGRLLHPEAFEYTGKQDRSSQSLTDLQPADLQPVSK